MERIPVTVHAVDRLSQAGLESYLRHQPGVELRGHSRAATGPAADPVAVLLADRMSDLTAAELRALAERQRRVVLVAGRLREPELVTALQHGVRVLVWRHQLTAERLVRAVRSAADGSHDLPVDLIGRVLTMVGQLRDGRSVRSAAEPVGLTPREIEVVRLLADGLETRQIAEKLAYSERTIKNILHRLIARHQLRNRTHAVAYALREGHI